MAKLLENTFRHVNIALVNEMVRFSNELDIDLWDAIDAAATKPFGYMAFRPVPGSVAPPHPRRPRIPEPPRPSGTSSATRSGWSSWPRRSTPPPRSTSLPPLGGLLNDAKLAVNGARISSSA